MCKFGCDELYEKGYISVKDGKVVAIKYTNSDVVNSKIKNLEGRLVLNYNKNNKKYYDQHLKINSLSE